MNRKLWIPIGIVILLMIVPVILFRPSKNEKKKIEEYQIENVEETKKQAEEYVHKLTSIIMEGGTQKELQEALYAKSILATDVMIGPDAYLRQLPKVKKIEKYNLDKYIELAKKLNENLEKAMKENFSYHIEGVADGKDYVSVLVNYQVYCYNAYIRDLASIQNELLIKAGYNLEDTSTMKTEKFEVDMYKAKIKAAQLLDSHLFEYKNTMETKKVYVEFVEGKKEKSSKSFLSYLMNLMGYTNSNHGKLNTPDKINQFLKDIDLKKPLNI